MSKSLSKRRASPDMRFSATDPLLAIRSTVASAVHSMVQIATERRGLEVGAAMQSAMFAGVSDGAYEIARDPQRFGLESDESDAWLWIVTACDGETRALKASRTPERQLNSPSPQQHSFEDLAREVVDEFADVAAHAPPGAASRPATQNTNVNSMAESNLPPDMVAEFSGGPLPGKVVIDVIGDPESKDGKDLARRYASVVGQHVVYSGSMPEPRVIRDSITSRWPWARQAAEQIENHLATLRLTDGAVRLQPLLFVGEPGCGKTSIARHVLSKLGIYATVVPCGGSNDGAGLAAVSRGWATARPSVVAAAVLQHRVANPGFVIDEIDKSARVGNNNGSPQGALLSMVREKAYHDACLLGNVDTTDMSFIATANTLKTIDEAVRDRFQIIRFEEPGIEHFDILLANVKADFAEENRLNPFLVPDLDRDDLDVLRAWLTRNRSARSFRMAYDSIVKRLIRAEEECRIVH